MLSVALVFLYTSDSKHLKIDGPRFVSSVFLTSWHKSLTTWNVSQWKYKDAPPVRLSPPLLPGFRLHDWHQRRPKHVISVTQFPWQCTLAVRAATHTSRKRLRRPEQQRCTAGITKAEGRGKSWGSASAIRRGNTHTALACPRRT